MAVKSGSQGARILNALKDGRWTSVAEIHRRAGTSRLNSRVSDMRKQGYKIEHREQKGKGRATLRHQYRLIDPPVPLPDPGPPLAERHPLNRDLTPRDLERRHRIYIVDERNKLLLMATAPTQEDVGKEIYKLGIKGELAKACIGWLDTFGESDNEQNPGIWILNPWDPKAI